MADRPPLDLRFADADCGDCARRVARLPGEIVSVPDDFDWTARDFEGFRRFMLDDLAAADPERRRWTESDMEMVVVEALAAGLDRASHALDALFGERFAETARLPQSLVALLMSFDRLDAAWQVVAGQLVSEERTKYGVDIGLPASPRALAAAFAARPQLMELGRAAAFAHPGEIQSLASLADLDRYLQSCPLLGKARTRYVVEAGRPVYVAAALMAETGRRFHDRVGEIAQPLRRAFVDFFRREKNRATPPGQTVGALQAVDDVALEQMTIRTALTRLIEPMLPIGSAFRIVDGVRVGIYIRLCVHVAFNHYRSEVEMEVRRLLSSRAGGLFDLRALGFGDSVFVSDVEEALLSVRGVEGVVIGRLQIVGRPASDALLSGVLTPAGHETLTLDADRPGMETGFVALQLTGGLLG